jgi:4-carboxymuconolactone decarboxylase
MEGRLRAILSAEVVALVDLSAALVAADQDGLRRCLERARVDAGQAAIEETILQSYLFLGFPAALEAMRLWREVAGEAAEHAGAGDGDDPAESGDAEADEDLADRLERWRVRGETVCHRVYGDNYAKLRANVAGLHPSLDRWMVIEGYGKVLGRRGLGLRERELCIVALLTADGREVQLHSHLRGSLNVGASTGEVEAAIRIALQHVDEPEWARRVEQLWWSVRERWRRTEPPAR